MEELIGSLIVGIIFILIFFVSFIPSIIAISRKHPHTGAIIVVNFFLGWTIIGWVIALAWACITVEPKQQVIISNQSPQKSTSVEELEKLAELKEKGIITEEEFNKKKAQILGI